jgi:GNAT superfamily N-acetyltransferase
MVPPLPDTTEALANLMRQFVHPAIARYVVSLDGEPAGAGASYVWHGVAGIVGTATVSAFRRRGVQTALVAHAVNQARGRAELAVATTEPGSTSQRTFERLGFQVLYTRAILVRS